MTSGSRDLDAPTPSGRMSEILRTHGRGLSLGIRVAMPARVIAYDPVLQRAEVSTELLTVVGGNTPSTAAIETVLPPVPLPMVPVVFPYGAAGGLTFPIGPGDTGLLVFADRSLDRWKTTGVAGDPGAARAHSLSDGVFLPGLHPNTAPITPSTALGGTVLEGVTVLLGRAATLGVARLGDGVQASAALSAWAAAVEAALVVALAPIAPAASWATLGLGAPNALAAVSSASPKVRAE